jgi:gliding motility-associated-like protein
MHTATAKLRRDTWTSVLGIAFFNVVGSVTKPDVIAYLWQIFKIRFWFGGRTTGVFGKMKKTLLLSAAFLLIFNALRAQTPLNDDCTNPISLTVSDPLCDQTVYTNVGATPSNIGVDNTPACFNGMPTRDVWFTFTCPDTLIDIRLYLTGVNGAAGIENPQIAIYRGDCLPNELAEYDCVIADLGETELFIDLLGLTPGFTYFVRVADYSPSATPNSGQFTLCATPVPPVFTIDEGGSTACTGSLADSGGPNGDYSADENYTYTICPTTPSACINFTLQYYSLDDGPAGATGADILTFYDGPNANSPVLSQINGGFGVANPVDGGGGVCFNVQATSGCLTVVFQSDGVTQFEGFLGSWQCSTQACPPDPSPLVNVPASVQNIVNSIQSAATQVTVTNITCAQDGIGTFTLPTADNDLQMEKGLVLSSGKVTDVPFQGTYFASTIQGVFGVPNGDPDLDYLSSLDNGEESYDACVIELDVFVATDELTFEYVFGSEEYPEFVNSPGGFNDIFAFLVSGPGITGDPNLNNAKNIAVLPGSNTPVQINSVNNTLNWEYFRNNQVGQQLSYDGLTSDFLGVKKTLTARTDVIPCNTYHLKLAVADRGDASYDSGVFIAEIKGGTPNIEVNFASGIDYFIEDCSGVGDSLIITLSEPQDSITSLLTTIGGTATLGLDYVLNLPPVLTFLPGQTTLAFPIYPLDDNLTEGTETITIQLSNNFGCGTVVYETLSLEIKDNVDVDVNLGQDTIFVCAGATLQLEASGASSYFWQPVSAVSNPFIANPTTTPAQSQQLVVTGTIGTCVDQDTVWVQIVDPTMDLQVLFGGTELCLGEVTQLVAVNNVNNTGLTWTPTAGLSNPNIPNPIAAPTVTTTYVASVQIAGCIASDSVLIEVDTLFFPVLANDTTICQNYSVLLGSQINSTTQYQWAPAAGLDDPTASGPLATPSVNTTYTLIATSANGFCTQNGTVVVQVIAADVDITGDAYREICLGTSVPLTAVSTPASASQVVWSPPFSLSTPLGPNTVATPDESVTIVASYLVNGCQVFDSVRIRVDSLPESLITLRPVKEIYCPGDTVTLFSTTYEPSSFPDIDIQWLPDGLGQITPDSFWNLVIRAQVTDTFTRIINNRACVDTSTAVVPVGVIPEVTVTASPNPICVGQTVQLNATVTPNQTLEWMQAPGLSCTQCSNPSVLATVTTTYVVTTPDADCPAGSGIEVQVLNPPALDVPTDPFICPGGSIVLNNAPADPEATYTWVSNPVGFTSAAAQPSVSPTQTTTYTVTASGPACNNTRTVTVQVAAATLEVGADQIICQGSSVTLNATTTGNAGTFVWSPDSQTGPSITVTPSVTTTYGVTFQYTSANCTLTDAVTVTVNPAPVLGAITMTPDTTTLCEGEPFVLDVPVSGTPPYTFQWFQDGVAVANSNAQFLDFALSTDAESATYRFDVQVTDATGCSDESGPRSVTITRCFVIPNAFSPDGDGTNDGFEPIVLGGNVTIVEFSIFNRWGQRVFSATPQNRRWNGQVDGKDAPVDVYIYKVLIRNADGTEERYTGDVTLLR